MTDEAPQQQKKLVSFAADRVKQWNGLREDDYDFRSWAKGASRERLEAGCVYEYAREARKLRGLLVFMKTIRQLEPGEGLTLLSKTGADIDYPCSLKGCGVRGSLHWLEYFADELADNKSLAELERSFVERLVHFPLKAVQFVLPRFGDEEPPWPWRPWVGDSVSLPNRHIRNNGSEKIAIEIRWGDFNNDEIGKAMKEFARAYRPRDKTAKEPRR